ncbi:MAG: KilA-N domain-containing protein [Bacteroidales bacterium]|nr:KilA-N domain-containing protein [Bacteroidales bacterium]
MKAEKNESKATSLRMVEIDHQKFAVELIGDNVMCNLTQMAKPYGKSKRPESWLKTDEVCQYIDILSDAKNIASDKLVIVKKGGIPGNQGTWCTDYRLAMRFAQWLDPWFAIQVDQLLVDLMRGELALYKPFNGINPIMVEGKPYYNQVAVLKSLGFSTRSGMVSMRKRMFPQHFIKLYGRNFVTPAFCEYLKNRKSIVQLTIDFATASQLKGGQS